MSPEVVLAVDLGLKTGVAVFEGGRLIRYRSHNFGTIARLKRGAYQEVRVIENLTMVVVEGDPALARPWVRLGQKRGAQTRVIQAGVWREVLLEPRDRRTGADAKKAAGALALRIIQAHGAARPTSLRHDAAEAIAIGYWACMKAGTALPI